MNSTQAAVAVAEQALAIAVAEENEAKKHSDNCEPEQAIEAVQALTIKQAHRRKAERLLTEARAAHEASLDAARQAEITRCAPLASHEHFVSELGPIVKRMVKACREAATAITQAKAVLSSQNESASVCGAPKLTMSHVLAHFVAEVSMDPKAHVDTRFIAAYSVDRLATVVMTLAGESPFERPVGMADDEVIAMVLRGESPSAMKREYDALQRNQFAKFNAEQEIKRQEEARRQREEERTRQHKARERNEMGRDLAAQRART